MNRNLRLLDFMNLVSAIKPLDLNGAAEAGDWVSLKNYNRLAIVFFASVGSNGTDITLTIEQATAVAGTGAKALNVTEYFHKSGADLLTVEDFTRVSMAAGNTITRTNNDVADQMYVIDIQAEDLDIANDFDCVRVSANDPGASKIGCAFYLLWDARYMADPLPDAITN